MAVRRNTEIFEQAMAEVFGQGNLEAVEQFFAPDFQEHEEGPGKDRGREGLKDIVRIVRGAFPDLRVTVEAISEDGDQTWARVTFSGTNTGELMGHRLPAARQPGPPSTSAGTPMASSPSTGAL